MDHSAKRRVNEGDPAPNPKRRSSRPDPRILTSDQVGTTKWVSLSTVTYVDRDQVERKWDVVSRTTKKVDSYADAVVIVCVVNGGWAKEPHIVLVKQWRPAMAKYCIEMPAGLIDAGENPKEAAVRELKEECGLVGEATSCSPELNLSPGISNETAAVVHVKVDLSADMNVMPSQNLDDGEDIEVLYLPVSNLVGKLQQLDAEGCSIFMGLYGVALGLQMK